MRMPADKQILRYNPPPSQIRRQWSISSGVVAHCCIVVLTFFIYLHIRCDDGTQVVETLLVHLVESHKIIFAFFQQEFEFVPCAVIM